MSESSISGNSSENFPKLKEYVILEIKSALRVLKKNK